MDNKRNVNIIDKHLKLKTTDNLADYLEEYFERKGNTKYCFYFHPTSSNVNCPGILNCFANSLARIPTPNSV